MILDRIVLHNFGPYLGRHEIELGSNPPKKPVVLFGGMNGGGKTSLLTALQLVLHGRQSGVWKGAEPSYDSFLRKCIHRRADPEEGAGIELSFTSAIHGEEQDIQISRYWRVAGQSVREALDVIRDGDLDTVLGENWSEWVEEFIPARVAPLFFFDGEKIEELADPDRSSQILKSAVHSLLGLDIVDQLKSDLEILERRKRKEIKGGKGQSPAVRREQELARDEGAQEKRIAQLRQETASLQNDRERLDRDLRALEERLAKEGGALFESRHELEEAREKLVAKGKELDEELRSLAAGGLPFALVLPLLEEAERDSRQNQHHSMREALLEVLDERDGRLLEQLRGLRPSKTLMSGVEAFLKEDRQQRSSVAVEGLRTLDASGLARAHAVQSHVLPTDLVRAQALLGKLGDVEIGVQTIDRKLAGLPDEEQIVPLLRERDGLRTKQVELQRKADALTESLRLLEGEHERLLKQLESARQELAESLLDDEDTQRILQHSQKARGTLAEFRQKVLESHVHRIEKLAFECFSTLMRKQHLVRDLRIDPQTFSVLLTDEDGHEVSPRKLSAGERQLLAIGLLWGLGRASGRPLPTVIDTPLGRLDSSHRTNLIQRYFPFASHQVILLSTDEEVDERYYEELSPFIARSHLLEFDDRKQETTVCDGYFWEVGR